MLFAGRPRVLWDVFKSSGKLKADLCLAYEMPGSGSLLADRWKLPAKKRVRRVRRSSGKAVTLGRFGPVARKMKKPCKKA